MACKVQESPFPDWFEDIQYPEPIGMRRLFYVTHAEIASLTQSFKDKGIKNVSMKARFTPDFVEKVHNATVFHNNNIIRAGKEGIECLKRKSLIS